MPVHRLLRPLRPLRSCAAAGVARSRAARSRTAYSRAAGSRAAGARLAQLAAAAVVVVVALAACAPTFDVPVRWTLDGDDPATACAALPAGSVVRFSAVSREQVNARAPLRETQHDASCAQGSTTLSAVGAFVDVTARLVAADEGGDDDVYGVAAPFALDPGAPGTRVLDEAAVVDIAVVRGTLHATLLVGGRSCGQFSDAAGAANFTVSLLQNTEPRTNVLVVGDVDVPCTGGAAEFVFAPVDVDAVYAVVATARIGDVEYATPPSGEGVVTRGGRTLLTVDLQRR